MKEMIHTIGSHLSQPQLRIAYITRNRIVSFIFFLVVDIPFFLLYCCLFLLFSARMLYLRSRAYYLRCIHLAMHHKHGSKLIFYLGMLLTVHTNCGKTERAAKNGI